MLLVFLAGIGLGVFMATNQNTRQVGWMFALWWVPGAAAAVGVLVRDLVTFTVGAVCFLVAGIVFLLKSVSMRRAHLKRGGGRSNLSEGTGGEGSKTAS